MQGHQYANQTPQQTITQPTDLSFSKSTTHTSAPTSPKGMASFLSRATSLTGQVTTTLTGQVQQLQQRVAGRDKQKIVLIIDDQQVDWSKYFRGKRIFGEFDIRIEQVID